MAPPPPAKKKTRTARGAAAATNDGDAATARPRAAEEKKPSSALQWGRKQTRTTSEADPRPKAARGPSTTANARGGSGANDAGIPGANEQHPSAAITGDSVGFTSLLTLADAGVQLERRSAQKQRRSDKIAASKSNAAAAAAAAAAETAANGVVAQSGRKGSNIATAASRGAASGAAPSSAGAPGSSVVAENPGKKRGRGPNKKEESEEDLEAKRRKRVQANRESARETIRRKHEKYDELSAREEELTGENATLRGDVAEALRRARALAAENDALREKVRAAAAEKGVACPAFGERARVEPPSEFQPESAGVVPVAGVRMLLDGGAAPVAVGGAAAQFPAIAAAGPTNEGRDGGECAGTSVTTAAAAAAAAAATAAAAMRPAAAAAWPNPQMAFGMFTSNGFNMANMPPPHLWNPAAMAAALGGGGWGVPLAQGAATTAATTAAPAAKK